VRLTFPVQSERLRRALEDGTAWPGDGILWMAGGPEPAGTRARSDGVAGNRDGAHNRRVAVRDVAVVAPDEQSD
jgi:hypothetical protein